MEKNDRSWHREIIGGPSRETLFDCLRFGWEIPYLDEFCWGRIYSQRLTNIPLLDVGRVYDSDSDTWRIKYKMAGHEYPFEAFYSTNTRTGWVCRASEIKIWYPVVPAYRPITDYEIMCLLQLASISRNQKLADHIKARIIRGIKDMSYPAPGSGPLWGKSEDVKDLFKKVINLSEPKNNQTVAKFREILDGAPTKVDIAFTMPDKFLSLMKFVEESGTDNQKQLCKLAKDYIAGLNNMFYDREVTQFLLEEFDLPMFIAELKHDGLVLQSTGRAEYARLIMDVRHIVRHTWELAGSDGNVKTGDDLRKAWPMMWEDDVTHSIDDLFLEVQTM